MNFIYNIYELCSPLNQVAGGSLFTHCPLSKGLTTKIDFILRMRGMLHRYAHFCGREGEEVKGWRVSEGGKDCGSEQSAIQGVCLPSSSSSSSSSSPQSDTFFAIMRLLLPDLDRSRPAYGMKETALAKHYIEVLNIAKESTDAQKLLHYRAPQIAKEVLCVCVCMCVHVCVCVHVLHDRCSS